MSVYFEDHSIDSDHGRRSLRAGAAIMGARVSVVAIQFVTFLILARLLSPEDYGLVGMVTAITIFAPLLVGLGTPDAVVQRAQVSERDISTLFWINVAVGCGITALMAASGPLIARFYGDQRLLWITEVSALTFVVSALSCQHNTLLRRAMKFRELAEVEVGANLLSASCAVLLAFLGFQYWSLVMRPVLLASFISLGVWLRCHWVPGRPAISLGVKEMMRQGLHLVSFLITDYIAGSSDRIAIGYRSGPVSLGYYQNAMFIYDNLCALLVTSSHNVAVASLGKARTNLEELRRLWRKALLTLSFFSMPTFGILSVTGHDLVVVLFGSKWSQAGVLVSIIAVRGIAQTVERTQGWLHVAAGRTDRWMRWGIVAMCAQLTALAIGLNYGPTGVAVAFVTCTFVLAIPAVAYSGRPFGVGATDVIATIWRPLLAALLALAIGFALHFMLLVDVPAILRIGILGFVYIATYLIIVVGVLGERTPLLVFIALAKDVLLTRFSKKLNKQSITGACDEVHSGAKADVEL
jgi:polysaccharide transporter, PST family